MKIIIKNLTTWGIVIASRIENEVKKGNTVLVKNCKIKDGAEWLGLLKEKV